MYAVIGDKCILCGWCITSCPTKAIVRQDGRIVVRREKCIGCRECECRCIVRTIEMVEDESQ